jgi:L-fuculose-phosphate aldolase
VTATGSLTGAGRHHHLFLQRCCSPTRSRWGIIDFAATADERGQRRAGHDEDAMPQPHGKERPADHSPTPTQQLKQQLVDAIRMLERAEIIDHNGHCSARRDAGSFFINSGASVRGALSVADIVAVDLDGHLIEGSDKPPLEFHIHSEIYRSRPDVNAVMHTHPKWSTFLTMVGEKYKPVYAQGVLLGDVPVMNSPLSVNTKPMGEKLAAILGRRPAAFLKAHGVVVVGADILECFALAAYVEENAYRQYMALQIGEPYVFSAEEQQACREKLWARNLFQKTWDHYYSKLG